MGTAARRLRHALCITLQAALTGPCTVTSEVKAEGKKKNPLSRDRRGGWQRARERARKEGGEGGAHPNAEMLQWLWAHTSPLGQAPAGLSTAAGAPRPRTPPPHAQPPTLSQVSASSLLPAP